jgi:hypothetical protein
MRGGNRVLLLVIARLVFKAVAEVMRGGEAAGDLVRELDPEVAQRLVKIARTTRDRVRMRRAGMALASMQGRSVPEIAVMFAAKEQTVPELIKMFNDRGLSALDPKARRGSTPRIGPAVREQICRTAKSTRRGWAARSRVGAWPSCAST